MTKQLDKLNTKEATTVIGFGGTYYTLWIVSAPYKVHYYNGFYIKRDYSYMQNLSVDLVKAINKVVDLCESDYYIDTNLRGEHGNFTVTEETHETKDEEEKPEDIFHYGCLRDENIIEFSKCKELKHSERVNSLMWYYNTDPSNKKFVEDVIISMGDHEIFEGTLCASEYVERVHNKRLLNAGDGHHFNNGDKVELIVTEKESFYFSTDYGMCYIQRFITEDGKTFMYMGSSPKSYELDKPVKIKATIKHDSYEGTKQTKLLRIKILD